MEHTHIVDASALERYADTRDSEAVIPELVNKLVNECPDLTICRIPYGDAINQAGWDGRVGTETGFKQFVPKKLSLWEIGTGGKPQDKATREFKKRTDSMSAEERGAAAFVFVTPRSSGADGWNEPDQTAWVKAHSNFGWREVKIIDGIVLADWLCEFPVLGKWLCKKMGITKAISGFTTVAEHWDNIQTFVRSGDPPLPAQLFLIGRDQACTELQRLFAGELHQMIIGADNQNDVEDFVAAFLESLDSDSRRSYSNRCVFIENEDAWLAMTTTKLRHVLVASSKLDLDASGQQLHAEAKKRGHAIIICSSGGSAEGGQGFFRLRNPGASVIEKTLTDAGYSLARARELASAGVHNLAALKRYLRGLGAFPPYATWEAARLLAQAGLVGNWAGENLADRAAVEKLLGKSYGEWIENLRPETLRSDTPLIQRNENWKIISRAEAWSALGPQLYNDDLDRFQQCALIVLGENDPSFDLTAQQRLTAIFSGKVLQHSTALRRGIAETLALLGSRPKALTSCSQGKAEAVALLTVRQLLNNAEPVKWFSLNNQLPLLAEASPDEFLDAVEKALLQPKQSPFNAVFSKEESGLMGWNYMTGLLWALESLAWYPDYLVRVTLLLGDLAAIDPGGNWVNRPANSLATIFLPWFPQTCADIAKRISAVEALLGEQPSVGWKLLLTLLPRTYSSTMGTHKPAWRDFISADWTEGSTDKDNRQQVAAYSSLAVSTAATDLPKLAELIERLPDLPSAAQSRILEHLGSHAVLRLTESERLPLWEALVDLASKHRFFGAADWAMETEAVGKIDGAAAKLAPKSATCLHRRLFSNRDSELWDARHGEVDYAEQERKLGLRRQAAVREILELHQITGLLEFTRQVASPEKVGLALGCASPDAVDADLFPQYLGTEEKSLAAFMEGFVWGRLVTKNWFWADTLPIKAWTIDQKTAFLRLLPFVQEAWQRAAQLLGPEEGTYWRKANVNPWAAKENILHAVQKLLDNGRPRAALRCFPQLLHEKVSFPPELAVRALMESLTIEAGLDAHDHHDTAELIKWLQDNPAVDSNALFQIEWNYLPLLDRLYGGSAKTLERRLATDPTFFCEVVRTIFRSDKVEQSNVNPTDKETNIATNAYRLLRGWRTPPGFTAANSFDGTTFVKWLDEVRAITAESGHLRVAMSQVGQVLPYVPADADGLWIHHSVAEVLNSKDAADMRSGFTCQLVNARGVFTFTHGRQEREIAAGYRTKAEALEGRGYARFATAMRELAENYEHDAEREVNRNPYGD